MCQKLVAVFWGLREVPLVLQNVFCLKSSIYSLWQHLFAFLFCFFLGVVLVLALVFVFCLLFLVPAASIFFFPDSASLNFQKQSDSLRAERCDRSYVDLGLEGSTMSTKSC